MANPQIKFIVAPKANPPGPYSHVAVHDGTAYISSQLGSPAPGEETGSIADQTQRAFASIVEILRAAGSDLSRVLKVTVYLSDFQFFAEMNEAYLEVFGDHRPARTTIACKEFPGGCQVAFDAIAAV